MDNLLNIREAAAYLNISPDTLYRLVERDEVPAKKIGGSWRLSRSRLEEFVDSRAAPRRPRVLVVEPDLEESLRLLGYIEAQGFDNQAVATVEEAVNLPGDESWDLVFMDAPGDRRVAADRPRSAYRADNRVRPHGRRPGGAGQRSDNRPEKPGIGIGHRFDPHPGFILSLAGN